MKNVRLFNTFSKSVVSVVNINTFLESSIQMIVSNSDKNL